MATWTSNVGVSGVLTLFGYTGNGIVEQADALQLSSVAGTSAVLPLLLPGNILQISVPLNTAVVQPLLGSILGLNGQVNLNGSSPWGVWKTPFPA